MKAMLLDAMTEALGSIMPARGSASFPCWIGLPEPRPGLPRSVAQFVRSLVSSECGMESRLVHLLQLGHSSGLMALQAAASKISSEEIDFCLVACVDSYYDRATLEWLDGKALLLSSENRNGFIPGEGAAACLLASHTAAHRHRLPVLATLRAVSTAVEPHTIRGTEVCLGDGLTAVLKSVIASLQRPEQAITATYCDLNGERYRNEELVYALLRTQEAFVDAHDYQCPADCWGDVGAASGPLFASLAIASYQRGYAKGTLPVLWTGSESGYRAAVLLRLGDG
jgi:3-oxoacyl-[acyl-carrier-protein] synthase-1